MAAPELDPDFTETRARTVTLPGSATSPWLARQLVAQWCREWSLDAAVDEAMVVVSELVTAAVSAGAATVWVSAALRDDRLEVAVSGPSGPIAKASLDPAEDDGAGRGMEVVRGLGTSVEVRSGEYGPTTVVAIPLSRAP